MAFSNLDASRFDLCGIRVLLPSGENIFANSSLYNRLAFYLRHIPCRRYDIYKEFSSYLQLIGIDVESSCYRLKLFRTLLWRNRHHRLVENVGAVFRKLTAGASGKAFAG